MNVRWENTISLFQEYLEIFRDNILIDLKALIDVPLHH